MSDRLMVFVWLVIATIVYAPIGIYIFDNSLATMFDRAYFSLGGAAIALYAHRHLVGGSRNG